MRLKISDKVLSVLCKHFVPFLRKRNRKYCCRGLGGTRWFISDDDERLRYTKQGTDGKVR